MNISFERHCLSVAPHCKILEEIYRNAFHFCTTLSKSRFNYHLGVDFIYLKKSRVSSQVSCLTMYLISGPSILCALSLFTNAITGGEDEENLTILHDFIQCTLLYNVLPSKRTRMVHTVTFSLKKQEVPSSMDVDRSFTRCFLS